MKILFAVSLFALFGSIVVDLIFNLITFPLKNEIEKDPEKRPLYEDSEALTRLYYWNRPKILRENPLADALVRNGSTLLYLVFSLTALIGVYLFTLSVGWTLICIPALVFVYFLSSLVSVLLTTLMMKRADSIGGEEDDDADRSA